MAIDRAKAKEVYESSFRAGYSPEQSKARLFEFLDTGSAPVDPTEEFWSQQVQAESRGNQSAVSPKGATGRAQVMPKTGPEAAKLAGREWDPVAFKKDGEYNEAIGRAYMRKQMEDFGDKRTALAAYNAGPGRVRRVLAGKSTLPEETRNYIDAIAPKGPEEPKQMTTREEKIRSIYEKVMAEGGDEAQLRAELGKAFGARPAPENVAVETPPPVTQGGETLYGQGWQAAPGSKIDRLQNVVEQDARGAALSRLLSGAERSVLGNIQGARKLINQATGDEETVDIINAQNQRALDFWREIDPEGGGVSLADIGRFGADAATFAAGPAGGATLAGRALAGAGTGAAQGLLAPTTAEDSQIGNAALGGALGAALPSAGALGRKIFGSISPEKQAAANYLRSQGVDIPRGADYEGWMGEGLARQSKDTMAEAGPGLSSRIAELAGAPELSNEVLENTTGVVGSQIGGLFRGLEGAPDKEFVDRLRGVGMEYLTGLNSSVDDPAVKITGDLLQKYSSGQPLSGKLYQKYRSQIGTLATKGTADEKQAFKGLKGALDDLMRPLLEGTEKEGQQQALNAQFRLLKILRGGKGISAEGVPVTSLANKIETAQNRGGVSPDVRELLRNAAIIAPKARIGVDSSADTAGRDIPRGLLDALWQTGAGALNWGMKTGRPQAMFNQNLGGKSITSEAARNALLPILLRLNSGD